MTIDDNSKKSSLSLLKIALPIILSSCLHIMYDITDMFWVGKIGSNEVAAIGSASFFIKLGWSLVSIITIGTMVHISQSIGAKQLPKIKKYISAGLLSTLLLGILYGFFTFFFAKQLIGVFHIQSDHVNQLAEGYLRISSISLLILFLNLFFTAIIDAHAQTRISFRAVLVGNIINLILDPIFIWYLNWGVDGAAWATVLSQGSVMFYLIYLIKTKLKLNISLRFTPWIYLRKIVNIGSAPALQRILFSLIAIVIGRIVSIWGTDAIAAQKLGLQIESISFLLMGGIMQATAITTGQYYGQGNTQKIMKNYRTSLKLGFCIAIPASLLFILFPEILLSFFVSENSTIEIGSSYLRIVGISQIFATLEMLTAGAYTGQGLTKYPATVSILFTLLRIPLALFLGQQINMGIDGVWWSISITSILKGGVLFILYRRREKSLLNRQLVS